MSEKIVYGLGLRMVLEKSNEIETRGLENFDVYLISRNPNTHLLFENFVLVTPSFEYIG